MQQIGFLLLAQPAREVGYESLAPANFGMLLAISFSEGVHLVSRLLTGSVSI